MWRALSRPLGALPPSLSPSSAATAATAANASKTLDHATHQPSVFQRFSTKPQCFNHLRDRGHIGTRSCRFFTSEALVSSRPTGHVIRDLSLRLRAVQMRDSETEAELGTAVDLLRSLLHLCTKAPDGLMKSVDLIAKSGRYDLVRELLEQSKPLVLFCKQRSGQTVLFRATMKKEYELVKVILQVDATDPLLTQAMETGLRQTPLILAAHTGDMTLVKLLLDANSSKKHLLAINTAGQTALMSACNKGYEDVVRLLLTVDSSTEHVAVKSRGGSTALMFAAHDGHLDVVKCLLEFNSSKDNLLAQCEDGWTALFWACRNSHIEVVKYLVNFDPSPRHVNLATEQGVTALHIAQLVKDQEVIRFMVAATKDTIKS